MSESAIEKHGQFNFNRLRSYAFLLNLSRPLGWMIAPLVFVFGFYFSGAAITYIAVLQILLLSVPYCVILYGINDIYDYDSDKLNPRKKYLKLTERNKYLVKKFSIYISGGLLLSSFLSSNPQNILCMVLLIALSYAYSVPPVRLKERPPLDSISNGVLFFVVFGLGYSYGGDVWTIPLKIYLVAVCVMGIHSFGTVMDYSTDKKAGHRTFAVLFGKRLASSFALVVFIAAILFSNIETAAIIYYFIYCSILFLISVVIPSEKLALYLFRLIFAGFIITAAAFIVPYVSV
jgi:4-hydroxybenzoate polyprenyltransferase